MRIFLVDCFYLANPKITYYILRMTNLILCGGAGTRLWPVSTKARPKQFCNLLGGQTLFERTVTRNAPLSRKILVVTNVSHYELARTQLESALSQKTRKATEPRSNQSFISSIPSAEFILEPVGRNTAPAIALACLALDPEEIVLVTPSDHTIEDEGSYREAVFRAAEAAADGRLVTFGLKPEYPETGYGYIEIDMADYEGETRGYWRAASFREKPDKATAETYIAEGRFFWNSGMFCFKAGVLLDELRRSAPDIYESTAATYLSADRSPRDIYSVISPDELAMKSIRADSIDFAVMEKSDRVAVIPCSIEWNDLGSWDAIYEARAKDKDGSSIPADTISLDSRNNLVLSGKRPIALVEVDDIIVIDTDEGLLVMKRGEGQRVKEVVDLLKRGLTP
jgi:mannose-1-phosphate guanylyltransferase